MFKSVLVDDIDVPSITYEGQWLAQLLSSPPTAPGKSPYTNTLHMISTKGSFEYQFRGSEIAILGFSMSNNNLTQVPWECTIDGNIVHSTIGASNSTLLANSNSNVLCYAGSLTDSDLHTLTFNVSADSGHPFYFDYIEYFPTDTTAFDNATVLIHSQDPEIKYNEGWEQPDNLGQMTATGLSNSSFTFMFEGVSLALSGLHTQPNENSNAWYSIDDQSQVFFDLSPNNGNYPTIFFEIPQLSYGKHKLTVTLYQSGMKSAGSFTLNALIIQNATVTVPNLTYPSQTTLTLTPTAIAQGTPISSPDSISASSTSKQKLTPIAGGVIGGLVTFLALVLLLAAFNFLRRRRKNKRAKATLLLHRVSRRSAPYIEGTSSVHTHRPPSPPSSSTSSSSLSYTSRSDYPHTPQVLDAGGYWDTVSLARQTRGHSVASSVWDGITENGLLKRPDDLKSLGDSDAKAARVGLPSNPAVYLEAHRRALHQLLGTGLSTSPPDALTPVPEGVGREESDRSRQFGTSLEPDMLEQQKKEEIA